MGRSVWGVRIMERHENDFRWLTDHPGELHRLYRGKWLAVVGDRIVAVGSDGKSVHDEARRLDPQARIVLEVVEPEVVDPIYGCLFMA